MKSLVALIVVLIALVGMIGAIWFLMHFPWQHNPPAPPPKQSIDQRGG